MTHMQNRHKDIPQINKRYVLEYLALVEVGATYQEAVVQISQSNEVEVSQVEINCAVTWVE